MNHINDPSADTALVKDALEFVNRVRKDTRENFMLGAQSEGYFLEDTGSASDMAKQLVKLTEDVDHTEAYEIASKHCMVPSIFGSPRCACGKFFNHFFPAAVEEWILHIKNLGHKKTT